MVREYTPKTGPSRGETVMVSDYIDEILKNSLEYGPKHRILAEIGEVAAEYPDYGVIEFLGDDPASQHITQELLTTTKWGMEFMNAARGGPLGMMLRSAAENPEEVKLVAENIGQEVLDLLFNVASENQEEVQEAIRIAIDSC